MGFTIKHRKLPHPNAMLLSFEYRVQIFILNHQIRLSKIYRYETNALSKVAFINIYPKYLFEQNNVAVSRLQSFRFKSFLYQSIRPSTSSPRLKSPGLKMLCLNVLLLK